ncbi:MAG: leucyl aminopeptidase [Lachnospiraceae bacterium]|nr:leucyl aminopeptidase [Lachnospiraceae bacterium]
MDTMITKERFALVADRILQIREETILEEPYCLYFKQMASFLVQIKECYEYIAKEGLMKADPAKLKEYHDLLYGPMSKERYETGYLDPAYAVAEFGKEKGQLLSCIFYELVQMTPYCFEQDLYEITIRMELFVELYSAFTEALNEDGKKPEDVPAETLKDILYWFIHDNTGDETERRVRMKVDPSEDFAYRLIMESDLSDPSYLYRFGEYISENEIGTAAYLALADEEQIKLMADTYTEGYRIGFEKTGKDLSIKEVVQIIYPLGFERMIKIAIGNFENMGLKPSIMREAHSIFEGNVSGFYSTVPNRQLKFDHKEDEALFLDKKIANRRLEADRSAFECVKELAKKHAGPAVVEVFGETPFAPKDKEETRKLDEKQQKIKTWYQTQKGQLVNEFIPGKERSFTIIAFPVPQIGEQYEQIMKETIELNTLDYLTYEKIQQTIIDALDQAEYVEVKGKGRNRTDIKVNLIPLSDPAKQTKFENCVADVNIPVGEVFTSPVLEGTEGKLHVTRVFLNELEYKDLWIDFKEGKITDYGCANFDTAEQNRKYIKDNILYHHDTLPIGEFAIGTNTTAYRMAQNYDIAGLLPILIAEKTGPHFAVGDTCYSHAEDVAVYNADGKEIVARDNSISLLRKTEIEKAYFNCHTDITIPYDELGKIDAVRADGSRIPIIEDGRFVLAGCEKLNEALD